MENAPEWAEWRTPWLYGALGDNSADVIMGPLFRVASSVLSWRGKTLVAPHGAKEYC